MKSTFTKILLLHFFCGSIAIAQETEVVYLSGQGAEQTVEWDFFCSGGAQSGEWSKIAVPSCWEQEGFGSYNYGHDENRLNETGLYRYSFDAPEEWKQKEVSIVFDGVMTDALVKINGIQAGPIHQGAFYRFSYDISSLLRYGSENQLEVLVKKSSDNESVEYAERKADYWIFGGIFRPVFLQIKPSTNIQRVAIDARASGHFKSQVFISNPEKAALLKVDILNQEGEIEKSIFHENIGHENSIECNLSNPRLWSSEYPNLYRVVFVIYDINNSPIHQHTELAGFRTIEVRKSDGIYVNGQRMKFKGVNRHSFHSVYGRTSSKSLSIEAVNLMKDMNMNAVRMSHYPPDPHFLEVCDSLGLYVLNELAGWQDPPYDDIVGEKLLKEMIRRDVNHPSVIMWSNGNEGGFNYHLDTLYAKHDIQQRHVLHPWQDYDGINTLHYISYNYLSLDGYSKRSIFMPTEFLHGLYDGGHGAGLQDYWLRMWEDPLCAGGFLWNLADEAIERRDKNDSLDTDGNHGADGILGPYNKKEASFYTIQEIWSPLQIEKRYVTPHFDGNFRVENRYHFTNLNECKIVAEWINLSKPEESINHEIMEKEHIQLNLAPMQTGQLKVKLPKNWSSYDLLQIRLSDRYGRHLNTWAWPLKDAAEANILILADRNLQGTPFYEILDEEIIIETENLKVAIDRNTGQLNSVYKNNKQIPISKGPIVIGNPQQVEYVTTEIKNDKVVISTIFENEDSFIWEVSNDNLIELSVYYTPERTPKAAGISFSYPKELIAGIKWRGDGPFRVYKNRIKGVHHGIWQKEYNSSITGVSKFEYPEFQGYHSNVYWAEIHGKDLPGFRVLVNSNDIFLKLYGEKFPEVWGRDLVTYPDGDIALLHAINGIGTKFKTTDKLGPQSDSESYTFIPKKYYGGKLSMNLVFDFRY